jgi:hypothetical protein
MGGSEVFGRGLEVCMTIRRLGKELCVGRDEASILKKSGEIYVSDKSLNSSAIWDGICIAKGQA